MTKLPGFLQWRYDLYLSEYVDLYGSLPFFFRMKWNNRRYSKHSKVAYVFANKGNVGDYISHRGLLDGIGVPGLWLLCSPYWEKQLIKQLKELYVSSPNCLLVIGGGGLLQPVFRSFWQVVLDSQLRFVVVGVGINRLEGREELDSVFMQKLVQKSTLFSVRDLHTKHTLEALVKQNIYLTVCPSVAYLQFFKKPADARSNTLLHVIHPTDMRLAGIDSGRLRTAVTCACETLGLKYKESTNINANHLASIEQIATARFVVSTRLHGCIMSYALSIPYLSIACDKKISYFNDSHTGKETIEARKLYQADAVTAQIRDIMNASVSSERVAESLTHLYTVFADVRQLIFQLD